MTTQATTEAARAYVRRGFHVVPIPHRTKKPVLDSWQHLRITEETLPTYFNGKPQNVGLLVGCAPSNLVDIDLDVPEAARAAEVFLPPTDMMHGRPGKPRSHRWYRTARPARSSKYQFTASGKQQTPTTLVELRGLSSKGTPQQTVIPPSTHISGEPICWEHAGDPAQVEEASLRQGVAKVAACALLARHWPGQGSRDDAAMALSGWLLRAGWSVKDTSQFVTTTAQIAGDEEWEKRDKTANTDAALKGKDAMTGEPLAVTGAPRLAELLQDGTRVVQQVGQWLRLRTIAEMSARVEQAIQNATQTAKAEAKEEEAPNESDLGNALRFKRLHQQRLRYCQPLKCWFWYDGTRWRRDETGEVRRAAHQTVRAIYQEAAVCQDNAKRQSLGKWALTSEEHRHLRAMVTEAEGLLPITPEQLDAHPMLLNCLNGTIDLSTGQRHPHNPLDYLTKLAPVTYDPAARLPKFEQFLDGITCQDTELRAYLQRALGYSITGITREKVVFFGYGEKDSGKTTLLESLKAVLGDYAFTADFNAFLRHKSNGDAANPTIADLKGRRFVGSSEVDEGAALAVALVKWLSGGDTLTARRLHENPVTFKPTHKLWLIANHTPKVPTDDPAIWSRIKRIPFKMKLAQVDPSIKADLTDPAIAGEAILAWLVQGCLSWRQEGIGTCKAVEESTAAYRKENDQLAAFVEECCVEHEQAKVTSAALWTAYTRWVEEGKERLEINSRKKFGDLLSERGYQSTTLGHAGSKAWQGIGLRAMDADGSPANADGSPQTQEGRPEAGRTGNADGSTSHGNIFSHNGPTDKNISPRVNYPSAHGIKTGQERPGAKIDPSAPAPNPSAGKKTRRQHCWKLVEARNYRGVPLDGTTWGGSKATWNKTLFGGYQLSDQQVERLIVKIEKEVEHG